MKADSSRLKTCRIRFWVWCFFGILQGSGGNSIRWVCKRCTWSSWLPEYWCWRSVVHYVVNFTKARQWDLDVVQLSMLVELARDTLGLADFPECWCWRLKCITWSIPQRRFTEDSSPEISINVVCLYEREFLWQDQDLMQFLKIGTLIKCRLEYWKISGRSVNWGNCTTPNTDTRTLRGKYYTRSIKILLTWIIGQGGIC